MYASGTTSRRRRTSHKATLPPAAFELLGPNQRRKVHAIINRTNPCVDCDFAAASARDLKNHYTARSKHGAFMGGPPESCFRCGQRFCTKQAMDGHHGVVHADDGAFAKLQAAGFALPGQAQRRKHPMVVASATSSSSAVQPARTPSASFAISSGATCSGAGTPPSHQGLGFDSPPYAHPPSPLPEMTHFENTDFTAGEAQRLSLTSQLLQSSPSFDAMNFDPTIHRPQEEAEDVPPGRDTYQRAEAYKPHTSESAHQAVGLERLYQAMLAGEF